MKDTENPKYQDANGEFSIVRYNLLTQKGYSPYCGNNKCIYRMPRTQFNGKQFDCPCGFETNFEPEFIVQLTALNTNQRSGIMPTQKQLDAAQKTILRQKDVIAKRDSTIADLKQNKANLREEIKSLKNQLSTGVKMVKFLEKGLTHANNQVDKLESKQADYDYLIGQNKALQKEVDKKDPRKDLSKSVNRSKTAKNKNK